MNFLIRIFSIIVLSGLLQWFLPWWSLAIVCFAIGFLIFEKAGQAFIGSFIAIFLLWSIFSYFLDWQNESILSEKVAEILFLPHPYLLILVSGLIGGLVGGLAGLSGNFLRQMFIRPMIK